MGVLTRCEPPVPCLLLLRGAGGMHATLYAERSCTLIVQSLPL